MELFKNCGDDFIRATSGKNWKTTGLDVQYCLEVIENVLFVHYQCSTSKSDWKHSFQFLPKKVCIITNAPIYVHRGLWKCFVSAWGTVYQEILNIVKNNSNINTVLFDGHSFGGAMADLSYLVSFNKGNDIIRHRISCKVETWGQPKLFMGKNMNLINALHESQKIYQCHNDLVTKVPPFYSRFRNATKVGDKFNLFKMMFHMEHYHTCYGEIKEC